MITIPKQMKTCPKCGNKEPKEGVLAYKVSVPAIVLLLLLTGGIGLIIVPLWRKQVYRFNCPQCNNIWGDARIKV